MTDEDWIAWAEKHSLLFGLQKDEDARMVGAWRPILDQFTRAELEAASRDLLIDPPAYRDKHVSGLMRILNKNRGVMSRAFRSQQNADADHRLECGVCQGLGFAWVPHPGCLIDGEFVPNSSGYKTSTAVTCSCFRGLRKAATYTGEIRPMCLAEYERLHGAGWPALMDEWAEEKRKMHGITAQAREVDGKLGPITRRLMQWFGRETAEKAQ